jgi:hypothetical protein
MNWPNRRTRSSRSRELFAVFAAFRSRPSNIDDYGAYNRKWLGSDVGFQYCLSLIDVKYGPWESPQFAEAIIDV